MISYFQPLRSNALNSAPVLKCSMFLKIQYLTYFQTQQAPSYKTLAPITCRHCQDQTYSGKNAELNLAKLLLQTYARLQKIIYWNKFQKIGHEKGAKPTAHSSFQVSFRSLSNSFLSIWKKGCKHQTFNHSKNKPHGYITSALKAQGRLAQLHSI